MFGARPLPRTLEAALRDLGASKAIVRAEAARDLGRYAEEARERILRALEAALRDDAGGVRAEAATVLADMKAVEALPALLVAIEDDDPRVRQMAISALGEIGDPRATERLRRALGDRRPEVRFQATIAFPRVCADRAGALDALLEATFDADPFVCHIAFRMAEELVEETDVDTADERPARAVDARFLARAEELLKSPSTTVRLTCAILLSRAGRPAPKDLLVGIARGELKTEDGEDEAAAIELCGELGLTAAQKGLERRAFGGALGLFQDKFAWHARVALARMEHPRASREILRELTSWDRDRRTLAVAAAGRARLGAARDAIAAMRGDEARADPAAVDEALASLVVPGLS